MSEEEIKQLKRLSRKYYNELREEATHHPSFSAEEAMKKALQEMKLNYEVDGICDDLGRNGITYVVQRDTYDMTLIFQSWNEFFVVDSYGNMIERNPERFT